MLYGGALLLLCALGLLLVRSGPPWPRLLALFSALAFLLAALDPRAEVERREPPRVHALLTAPGELAQIAEQRLQRVVEQVPGASLAVQVGEAGALGRQWLQALLRAGPGQRERLLVWSGPSPAVPGASAGIVATAAPVLPFDPEQWVLQQNAALQVGRPAELWLGRPDDEQQLEAQVRVRGGDGSLLLDRRVQTLPGYFAPLDFVPDKPGRATVEVEVPIDGAVLRRSGDLAIGEPMPVLVVEDGGVAAAALQAQGVRVARSERVPDDLAGYAAVVLLLPQFATVQQRLVDAVDDGMGLFVGGEALPKSGEPLAAVLPVQVLPAASPFGDGPGGGDSKPGEGEPKRPETAPPPRTDVPPPHPDAPPDDQTPPSGDTTNAQGQPGQLAETERRDIAIVLVVDRSGSMGTLVDNTGNTRMSYAKTSALLTAKALQGGDEVGIVSFGNDDQETVVLPMTRATEAAKVKQGVEQLHHYNNEQTWLRSALLRARDLLRPGKFAVKHVVVITDGELYGQEFTILREKAHELRAQGITVSIVQVGGRSIDATAGNNPEQITNDGGGRYLPVSDPTKVPVFVSMEVTRALGSVGRKPRGEGDQTGPDVPPPPKPAPPKPEPPKPEPPKPEPSKPEATRLAVHAVTDSRLLLPKPAKGWPSLGAAVTCSGRPDAWFLLAVGSEGSPLLAYCNHGLGRIAAFAADLTGPACVAFREDQDFPARLSQWVEALRSPNAAPAVRDLLRTTTVTPLRPTPAELQAMAPDATVPVQSLQDYEVPPPRTVFSSIGLAPEWALYALLAVLVLALGEWAAARRLPR